MRVSVYEDDPGFENYTRSILDRKSLTIFLDGNALKCCYTADEEQGFAIVACLDEHGRFIADGDEVKRETLYGKVEIRGMARQSFGR